MFLINQISLRNTFFLNNILNLFVQQFRSLVQGIDAIIIHIYHIYAKVVSESYWKREGVLKVLPLVFLFY